MCFLDINIKARFFKLIELFYEPSNCKEESSLCSVLYSFYTDLQKQTNKYLYHKLRKKIISV